MWCKSYSSYLSLPGRDSGLSVPVKPQCLCENLLHVHWWLHVQSASAEMAQGVTFCGEGPAVTTLSGPFVPVSVVRCKEVQQIGYEQFYKYTASIY